jgi:hypothetical protein
LRFVEGDHLHARPVRKLHQLGQQRLADLALELAEVVGDCDSVELPLDLAVDPIFEAAGMDQLAGALAVAGADEGVALCCLVAEAELARAGEGLTAHLMHVFVELQV